MDNWNHPAGVTIELILEYVRLPKSRRAKMKIAEKLEQILNRRGVTIEDETETAAVPSVRKKVPRKGAINENKQATKKQKP